MSARTFDGREASATVLHARGSEARPMSDSELEEKFRRNAALGGTTADAGAQIALAWAIDRAASVAPLMRSLAAPG